MADIRIEKKRKVWPWVLLIIILGVLAFLYFYGSMDTDEPDDMDSTSMEEVTHVKSQKSIHENVIEII